jgi:hypothetical protein
LPLPSPADSFPFEWIKKKWREAFHVTAMATSGTQWAVVMSRGAGYLDQVVELDFQYPSEGIHKRWDGGYRITALAATPDQVSGATELLAWYSCSSLCCLANRITALGPRPTR